MEKSNVKKPLFLQKLQNWLKSNSTWMVM